jgi:hypothetical protein
VDDEEEGGAERNRSRWTARVWLSACERQLLRAAFVTAAGLVNAR